MGTRGEVIETIGMGLGLTMLSSLILAVLLIIAGIEQNPGTSVEMENTVRVLCTGCGRNLQSGIKCEQCERWYHYSCGNVKVQTAERENWCCDKCRSEKVSAGRETAKRAETD